MKGETKNKQSTNIRDYSEGMEVTIGEQVIDDEGNARLVIGARNEGGYNGTDVDLMDVIAWVRANKPELLVDESEVVENGG